MSRSLAGAWIEIEMNIIKLKLQPVAPLRERGLKSGTTIILP